ncbi:hypothetical protein ACN28E_40745 [Archangium lansingense]|uniref:hypothetical protein n=1 Tax=Archangiaceae TaxID=39 RepID=UPI00130E5507|nr:hypothetical protein [Vitiosangium sp. GDMCC 1.1324]
MRHAAPFTMLMTTRLESLFIPGQGLAADPVKCGGNRDADTGTYKGRASREMTSAFSPERL